jgi:hypothetical protein
MNWPPPFNPRPRGKTLSALRPDFAGITPEKSLASYRECLGKQGSRRIRCSIRGTFDRGDLKEVRFEFRAMEFESICS